MTEHTNSSRGENHPNSDGSAAPPRRVPIIGVPISATNMEESTSFLAKNLECVRGKYICVSNVHTTVMAREDTTYWRIQNESLMSIPDGKPLSVVGRRVFPSMDRVTGPKFMRRLFKSPELADSRHYFYGGTEETISRLIETLHQDYPGLIVAGHEPSIFRDLDEREVIDLGKRIDDSKVDFVWVGIGAPRQEILCARLKGKVQAVLVGVGGAFNVLAGITPDAPEWMQKRGLEWFYRLIQEPRRLFKRYLVTNTKFVFYLLMDKLRKQ